MAIARDMDMDLNIELDVDINMSVDKHEVNKYIETHTDKSDLCG